MSEFLSQGKKALLASIDCQENFVQYYSKFVVSIHTLVGLLHLNMTARIHKHSVMPNIFSKPIG